jgi:hydrogenase expression/formation protein HypC
MCLAHPGRIVAISLERPAGVAASRGDDGGFSDDSDDHLWRMATVDFGGVLQPVSLACLPQAQLGDRVLVHVGLAISLVEEAEDGPLG